MTKGIEAIIVYVVTASWHNEMETGNEVVNVHKDITDANLTFCDAVNVLKNKYGVDSIVEDCSTYTEKISNDADSGIVREVDCEVNFDGDRFSVYITKYNANAPYNTNNPVLKQIG